MTILEAYMWDRFEETHRTPEWFRAERYEYCESDYMNKNSKHGKLSGLFSAILSAIF